MSNDRSPRDVCSITIGISGAHPVLLRRDPAEPDRRGPQLRLAGGLLLVRRPDRLARGMGLRRDRLHLGGEPVECGAQPQVLAERLLVPVRPDVLDHASRSSPEAAVCSRIKSLTSSSETTMPTFSATASSASSRATDCDASARI